MNSLNEQLQGRKIRLLQKYPSVGLNDRHDVFVVEGGFGASSFTHGTALLIKSVKTGETYRICALDRFEVVE